MSAITRTLGKWFGQKGTAVEVRAETIDGVRPVRKMTRSQKREAMLVQLQRGYGEVVETLKSLRDHMEEQSSRSNQMLTMMSGLPDLLKSIPETNQRQTQTLEAIRTHLQHQSESTAQLSGALTDLAGATTEQHKAMDELHQQLAANRASGEALRDSLGILAETMEHVTDSSKANVDAVNRIAEQSARNERHTGTLFKRSQRHSTAMAAVSWSLALVALAVSAYVAVMITRITPPQVGHTAATQAGHTATTQAAGLTPAVTAPPVANEIAPVIEEPTTAPAPDELDELAVLNEAATTVEAAEPAAVSDATGEATKAPSVDAVTDAEVELFDQTLAEVAREILHDAQAIEPSSPDASLQDKTADASPATE